jgi:hypothetical protein
MPIAAMIPLGTLRSGSLASSAASGTPSTARKNQIAKRHRGPDSEVPEWQERRRARRVGGRDIGQVRGIEAADRRDREDQQTGQRDRGDDEHDLERLADAAEVDADEQRVRGQVHPPAVGDTE